MLTGVNELIKFMHARLEEAHEKAPTVHAVASAQEPVTLTPESVAVPYADVLKALETRAAVLLDS